MTDQEVQPYPEHLKMRAVHSTSQEISEFLEWLQSEGIHLAEYDDKAHLHSSGLWPHQEAWNSLLARYFNIDLDKIEQEKREMLDHLRAAQEEA